MISHRITTNKFSPTNIGLPYTGEPKQLNPVVYLPGETKKVPNRDDFIILSNEEYEKFLAQSTMKPGDLIAYNHAISTQLDDDNLYFALVLGFVKFEELTYGHTEKPKYLMLCSVPSVSAYPSALTPYMRPDDGTNMSPLPKERQELIKSHAILSNRIEQIKRSARNLKEAALLRESI